MKSLVALCLLLSSPSWAQSLKVIKVKGSQAIVNVNGGDVNVGQIIKIPASGDPGDDELELTGGSSGPRRHLVGIDSAFFQTGKDQTSGGAGNNTTIFDLKARYGWNMGNLEYGAIGILGMSDMGTGNTTKFGGGGYFDFNFSANKAGNDKIFGVGVQGTYSTETPPNGATGTTRMEIYPCGFYKWFILKTPTALRLELAYLYSDNNVGGAKSKGSYIVGKAGFSVYF